VSTPPKPVAAPLAAPLAAPAPAPRARAEEDAFVDWLQQASGCEISDRSRSFLALGLDSLAIVRLAGALSSHIGVEIAPVTLFEHATPAKLWEHLAQSWSQRANTRSDPAAGAAELGARVLEAGRDLCALLERLGAQPRSAAPPDLGQRGLRELASWADDLTAQALAALAALDEAHAPRAVVKRDGYAPIGGNDARQVS
jgi:acyl carrier protein